MKNNNLNSRTIEVVWGDFYDSSETMEEEQSIIWRLLRCRYRMLLIKKEVTEKEVDDFMRSVAMFKKSIERHRCAQDFVCIK